MPLVKVAASLDGIELKSKVSIGIEGDPDRTGGFLNVALLREEESLERLRECPLLLGAKVMLAGIQGTVRQSDFQMRHELIFFRVALVERSAGV